MEDAEIKSTHIIIKNTHRKKSHLTLFAEKIAQNNIRMGRGYKTRW